MLVINWMAEGIDKKKIISKGSRKKILSGGPGSLASRPCVANNTDPTKLHLKFCENFDPSCVVCELSELLLGERAFKCTKRPLNTSEQLEPVTAVLLFHILLLPPEDR